MSHEVFLSYSSKDGLIADKICTALEKEQIIIWMAPRNIPHGVSWAKAIVDAINSSKTLVLVFSENANLSDNIEREVSRALHRRIPILTFRIQDFEPSDAFEYYLSSVQWMDGYDKDLEFYLPRLSRAVKNLLENQKNNQNRADPTITKGVENASYQQKDFHTTNTRQSVFAKVTNYINKVLAIKAIITVTKVFLITSGLIALVTNGPYVTYGPDRDPIFNGISILISSILAITVAALASRSQIKTRIAMASGLMLLLIGALSIIQGFPYVRLESGLSMVIAGSLAFTGGVIALGIGAIAARWRMAPHITAASGLILLLGGALSIVQGFPYVRLESGLAMVIAGGTAFTGGAIALGIGAIAARWRMAPHITVASGLILLLGGALSIIQGFPNVRLESGLAMVIAGGTAFTGGAITLGIGAIAARWRMAPYITVASGLILLLGGALSIIQGFPYVRLESGLSMVIAGGTAFTGGVIIALLSLLELSSRHPTLREHSALAWLFHIS